MRNRKTVPVGISLAALMVVLAHAEVKAEKRDGGETRQKKAHAEGSRRTRKAGFKRANQSRRRISLMRERARAVEPLIAAAAMKYQVDPYALWVIAYKETRFRAWLVSPVGARGLMQFMPGTAVQYGLRDSFDPAQSIDAAARYVRSSMNQFGGRLDLVWASYNAGPLAVEAFRDGRTFKLKNGKVINPRGSKTGGIPPYKETRDYVAVCWKVYLAAKNSNIFDRQVVAKSRLGTLPEVQSARQFLAAYPVRDRELDYLGATPASAPASGLPAIINTPKSSPLPSLVEAAAASPKREDKPVEPALEEVFFDVHSGARYLVRNGEIVRPMEGNPAGELAHSPEKRAVQPVHTARSVFYGVRGGE